MRRARLTAFALVLLLAAACTTVVDDALPGGATIECDGSTGVSGDACAAWGNEIIELGAPSTTFELQDVARLRISKPLFGFGSPCQVEYFLQRYPDDAVWTLEVSCTSE